MEQDCRQEIQATMLVTSKIVVRSTTCVVAEHVNYPHGAELQSFQHDVSCFVFALLYQVALMKLTNLKELPQQQQQREMASGEVRPAMRLPSPDSLATLPLAHAGDVLLVLMVEEKETRRPLVKIMEVTVAGAAISVQGKVATGPKVLSFREPPRLRQMNDFLHLPPPSHQNLSPSLVRPWFDQVSCCIWFGLLEGDKVRCIP
mmetsp:Transcript_8616/g.14575  ORF Transcript_8616/g.14575 Transcript_8616/m.14575 type:complete len:203 (+) Transcript_8616:171-779(+)